ncbi:MAG: sensor histidine kinase [Christensenellaceae bacterium]
MKRKAGKRRTEKLSVRLTGIFVGISVAILAVFTLISEIAKYLNEAVWARSVYVAGMAMILLILTAFGLVTNRSVVRRIESVNDAVSEISKGNYDLTVPVTGNDELAELSENFNKMAAELRANAFLSRDFARYVSHEFKTPLAVIRSYAESVQLSGADEETNASMQIILSETDRLNAMTKAILQLCRLDSTTLVEKKDVFSPAAQVRSELLSEQVTWGEKHIRIDASLDEFTMTGNESLTLRIWQNLISNAVKFTDENGTISIVLQKREDSLLFRIQDDGIGIAEDDQGKIFDLFFTGDRSHNQEGSGLGLPLTKKIVGKLGGEISFTSERGKGTTFTVILPF